MFFFVPLVIHFLPYSFLPISPFNPLGPLSLLLARVNERLTFFSVLQAASQRHPVLLERRTEYWRNQAEEAGWARGEEEVMSEAERSGLGYREESHGEGPAGIRQSTRMRVMEMKHVRPHDTIPHNAPPNLTVFVTDARKASPHYGAFDAARDHRSLHERRRSSRGCGRRFGTFTQGTLDAPGHDSLIVSRLHLDINILDNDINELNFPSELVVPCIVFVLPLLQMTISDVVT